MIIQQEQNTIMGSGFTSSSFKIKASLKAFQILSDKLYKFKIRAIVREISCNAIDAHRLAGHEKDFDVTLPSIIDQRFIVRDYGPGLSPDQVQNIFTVYFESTKENSNEDIGGFGLGCKSPFSYVDGFSVNSYYQGKLYVFNMFNGTDGPVAALMSTQDTDKPSGLEVIVPVEKEDIREFTQDAQVVYASFDKVKPNIISYSDFEINYIPEGDVVAHSNTWFTCRAYAIMGNVTYEIPIRWIHEDDRLFALFNRTTFFRFGIGELDILPSREELTDLESNKAVVIKKVKEYNETFLQTIESELATQPDRRTALRWIRSKYNSYGAWKYTGEMRYQGKSMLLHQVDMNNMEGLMGITILQRESNGSIKTRVTTNNSSYRSRTVRASNIFDSNVEHITVLINDTKQTPINFARAMWANGVIKSDIVVTVNYETNHHKYMAAITRLFARHERTIFKCSAFNDMRLEYAKKVRAESQKEEKRPKTANVYKWTASGRQALCLTAKEIRELKGFAIKQYQEEYRDLQGDAFYLTSFGVTGLLEHAGIEEFYIVRPSAYKQLEQNPNLECLATKLASVYLNMIDTTDPTCYVPELDGEKYWVYQALVNNPEIRDGVFIPDQNCVRIESLTQWRGCVGQLRKEERVTDFIDSVQAYYSSQIEEYKMKHPLIAGYIRHCTNISDEVKAEMVKLINQ